jgi:hypothetical protein
MVFDRKSIGFTVAKQERNCQSFPVFDEAIMKNRADASNDG